VLDEDNGANTKNAFRILTEQAHQNTALNPTKFLKLLFLPFDENIVGGKTLSYPDGPKCKTS
jgi:hypothetical protein